MNCSYIINKDKMESDGEYKDKDGNELSLEANASANANTNMDSDGNVEKDRDSDGNRNKDDSGGVLVQIEEGKEVGREAFASDHKGEMIRSGLGMDTIEGSNWDSPCNSRSTWCFCGFKMLTATHLSS